MTTKNTGRGRSNSTASIKKKMSGKKPATKKPVSKKATDKKPSDKKKPDSKSFDKKDSKTKPAGTGAYSKKPDAPGAKKVVTTKEKSKYSDFREKVKKGDPLPTFNDDAIRLNKYLSNAGICSRREADVLIQTGVVSVNGKIITEMGYKVALTDVVKYDGASIRAETKRYVLLNKPKGFVTSNNDPLGRKSVMGLVSKACKERIYPIGRLGRETTGLMLFTNDGDMAKKLIHPQTRTTKLYEVELNKGFNHEDLEKLTRGIEMEDGTSKFDKAEFVKDGTSRELGVEIHSNKNRIVSRTFEALGYEVVKLDRVKFSSLTKKDLPRGHYRHLTEKEVAFLKMS